MVRESDVCQSATGQAGRQVLPGGYYEYANGWDNRALYVRVHYQPRKSLHIELYIDFPKPCADVELKLSLSAGCARLLSLISPARTGWSCHGEGIGSLLGNCAVIFLRAIYPRGAVLTGWTQPPVFPDNPEGGSQRQRFRRFWAGFGVRLDEYNMFDVSIGALKLVDNGEPCLGYFPRIVPLSQFTYAGERVRDFRFTDPRSGSRVIRGDALVCVPKGAVRV